MLEWGKLETRADQDRELAKYDISRASPAANEDADGDRTSEKPPPKKITIPAAILPLVSGPEENGNDWM